MNANARKWVEALRSGEFEQANGGLRVADSYCCLGVACEIYRRETGQGKWVDEDIHFISFVPNSSRQESAELPQPVMRWLGLKNAAATYGGDMRKADSLIVDNDHGATFEEIADTIESEPSGLFKEGVK